MGALKEGGLLQYCGPGTTTKDNKTIANVLALLQKDYGEEQDCTLTSMTALMQYYTQKDIKELYANIEKTARKLGYRGNVGTNPLVIRTLMQTLCVKYHLKKTCYSCYLKGIGYTINLIKKLVNKNIPIILNLSKDGRNYYENHSVLIVGYKEIIAPNKTYFLLKIQDNWNKEITYIDYAKLHMISSINYAI